MQANRKVEQRFRRRVAQVYGKRKSALAKALTEAMLEWMEKRECLAECMKLLEEGVDMGGVAYKKREELHDRF